MASEARYQSAADVFAGWRDGVLSGDAPVLYPAGTGELARIEMGPGLVTLIGGAPGAGKTAFTMQLVFDAMRLTESLRVVVCNVEMPPGVLLDRQLARLSGIDATLIRHRRLTGEHARRIDQGLATLEPLCERLAFVRPPFDLTNVASTADAFEADVIVFDYLQRIKPPGDHVDRRGAVDELMTYLRLFADSGVAVVALSAVSRSKDGRGRSSYAEGLNLASFRESSELEFGADDAFLLLPDVDAPETVVLRHLKSRHGETRDMELSFDRRLQRFTAAGSRPMKEDRQKLQAAIASLWAQTTPAQEDQGEDEDDR